MSVNGQLDDIIAYQMKLTKTKSEEQQHFEQLYLMHTKAGKAKLWADVEVLHLSDVYKSVLLPLR